MKIRNLIRGTAFPALFFAISVSAAPSKSDKPKKSARTPASVTFRKESPELCAAVRGNGENLMAHFNSLAHVLEHYGFFDGLAGGSSASISIFIYESVIQNPALWDCKDCTPQDFAVRGALLLKSTWAYLDYLEHTDEAKVLTGLTSSVSNLQSIIQKNGIADAMSSGNQAKILQAGKDLLAAVEASDLRSLVNPELLSLLTKSAPSALKAYQIQEAYAAVQTFGKFQASDRKIFFRPGVVSFAALADKIGRIANFYAGRGGGIYDHAGMKTFLDRCAPSSLDLSWKDVVAQQPACGEMASKLIGNYRTKLLAAGPIADSRLDEPVGKYASILVGTGILEATEAKKFAEGLEIYNSNQGFDQFQFNIFNEMKFGYWGQESDLRKVASNPMGFADPKTAKRKPLAEVPWRVVLSYSPAEPGLSRLLQIQGSELVSTGGWSDLAPTLMLKDLGCRKVVYITRRGEDSVFGRGVARTLGMTEQQERALYGLDDPDSSLSRSLAQADGVWCTNWDAFSVFKNQLADLDRDSYASPLESAKAFVMPGYVPYKGQILPKHLGCGGSETGAGI